MLRGLVRHAAEKRTRVRALILVYDEEAHMSANIPPVGSAEPEGKHGPRLAERLATPKVFIGGIVTIAAVWFIIANNQQVRIHLWVTWVSARLWIVLLLTFLAGTLLGFLTGRRRAKRKER
jgi:uncharacterized integral membrane protein